MKLFFSKSFFAPLVIVFAVLSLTSCGKDYDLVSEYVVRDAPAASSSNYTLEQHKNGTAAINDITSSTLQKK